MPGRVAECGQEQRGRRLEEFPDVRGGQGQEKGGTCSGWPRPDWTKRSYIDPVLGFTYP